MMANGNGASAGITFQLTEEQKMIQKLARDFARNVIAPHDGQDNARLSLHLQTPPE